MKKIFLTFIIIFSIGLISLSIYNISSIHANPPLQSTQMIYTIKDYNGKIAVFTEDSTEPIIIYDVYTHLLPEGDIELLRKGIGAKDEFSLIKTLENFGL